MILKRWTPSRFLLSLTHQIGLSVSGTLVGSLLLAGLHAPQPDRPDRIDPMAERTSGGKLAARADAGAANADGLVTLTALPLILPLFTAPSVPRIEVALSIADAPAAPIVTAVLTEASKAWADVPHAEARRRSVMDSAANVVPPRRADSLPVALSASLDPAIGSGETAIDGGIWTTSRQIYHDVALWSGAILDRVVP